MLVEPLANPAGTTSANQLGQQVLDDHAEREWSVHGKLLRADRALYLGIRPGVIQRLLGDPTGHGRLDNPVVGDAQLSVDMPLRDSVKRHCLRSHHFYSEMHIGRAVSRSVG